MPPIILLLAMAGLSISMGMPFPGPNISRTTAEAISNKLIIENNTLSATFLRDDGHLHLAKIQSPLGNIDLDWTDANLFSIWITNRPEPLTSSAMKLVRDPEITSLEGKPRCGARLSDRLSGQALRATFMDEATGLRVEWTAEMKDGANYLRQVIHVAATHGPVAIDSIEMIRAIVPDARVDGYTDGAPLTTEQLFLGVEHPMADNTIASPNIWTPAEMQARIIKFPISHIAGGQLQIRFDYQRGNHRIDVAGVSLLSPDGNVICEDIHNGFSGHAAEKNTYQPPVPNGVTAGTLRITLGGNANDVDSWGKITLSGGQINAPSIAVCTLPRHSSLELAGEWRVSDSIGVSPKGQLRRAFLYYLERERAHPYRQYWHYNSWFDLNIGRNDNPNPLNRMTEQQCLAVIGEFDRELYQKRGIGLNGFVWDDGWDDWNSLWQFHQGFPNGFTKLKEAAAREGAGIGAWLSPWGGYGAIA